MSQDNLKYQTKKGLYWKFAEQFSNYGIQFIVGIFMARMLSPEDYGLTAEDLAPRRRGRPRKSAGRSGTPAPAKYRDPKTGKTWSGRGRAPAWLGKNRDRFLIAE